jgi:tRNA(Ile)-lysidine synthase
VQIGYRNSAFHCRPAGRCGTRTFKKIAQEYAIPPWQRDIVPVLLIDDRPAAVANYCVCQPFAVAAGQPGWMIEWIPD